VLAVTEPPAASSLFDGLRAEAIDVDAGSTIYDLSLTLEHGDDAVGLVLTEGDPQLTAAATRIEATLPAVLEAIAADPSRPMGEILSTVRSGARSQAGHRGAVNPDERRDTLRPPELARRPARPPHTSTELSLAEIWHGVLGQPVADAHADFFELGGESLEALRMIVLIHERFAVRVPLVSLLETASLASLACEIDGLLERRPSSDRTTS
jgi:acyl carrier protein